MQSIRGSATSSVSSSPPTHSRCSGHMPVVHYLQHRAHPVLASVASSSSQVEGSSAVPLTLKRREVLLATLATQSLLVGSAQGIQGLTAGRIPGLSQEADGNGFFTYMRPEGKSGGHGVGWSEIPRYAFKVPAGWGEIPVSIADLGGTEIDLRYTSKDEGDAAVVVAPIMRFADIGFNAKVTIEQLGEPDKIIKGFAPEIFGKPIEDEDILETIKVKKGSLTFYNYYVKPYRLVSTTAFGNRIFILSVTATARQWRKHEANLRAIANSFVVPDA